MKRIFFALVVGLALLLGLSVSYVKPFILSVATKQLGRSFAGSVVSIENCMWDSSHLLLFNIHIKKAPAYAIAIKEIAIQFHPLSIIKKRILKVSLTGASLDINTPKQNVMELASHLTIPHSKKPFRIRTLDLSHVKINLASKGLNLRTSFSSCVNWTRRIVETMEMTLERLDMGGFVLDGVSLGMDRAANTGDLTIQKVQYGKAKLEVIRGHVRLENNICLLENLSGKLFGGIVEGRADITLRRDVGYLINLKLAGVDTEIFIGDFDLGKKLQMSGKLTGILTSQGRGRILETLNGDFSVIPPGGTLIIQDTTFLENAAKASGQPLDILM